jgi:hypothetical protein
MATIAAYEKSRMLSAGRTSPGSSKRMIRNVGPAISTLSSVSTPNDCNEGTVRLIWLVLKAVVCSPWQLHRVTKTRGTVVEKPLRSSSTWDYRRLPCRSAITPDATTTKTMTIASASKYHALKNSSMADLHRASHCHHFNLSKGGSYATNRIGGHDGRADSRGARGRVPSRGDFLAASNSLGQCSQPFAHYAPKAGARFDVFVPTVLILFPSFEWSAASERSRRFAGRRSRVVLALRRWRSVGEPIR